MYGIFTHGLESYTPTKTDTIYNWDSVRSFVTYGAPPYFCAILTHNGFECLPVYFVECKDSRREDPNTPPGKIFEYRI